MADFGKAVLSRNRGLKCSTSFNRHFSMYNKTHAKHHWGEEGVGPGRCLAHTDSYVRFILLEADADIHNTGKEMGRTGIQDVSG